MSPPCRYTPADRRRAFLAWVLGGSSAQAARDTGIKRQTIEKWAKRHVEEWAEVQAEAQRQAKVDLEGLVQATRRGLVKGVAACMAIVDGTVEETTPAVRIKATQALAQVQAVLERVGGEGDSRAVQVQFDVVGGAPAARGGG